MSNDWNEAKIVKRTDWCDTHISLRMEGERPDFIPGQFARVALDIDGERIARPYSCVNPPDQSGVEIFFNIVPDGPLSHALAKLKEGDPIWLGNRINGFLTLPEVPETAKTLWMVATGTGIGPFLSILQSQATTARFDKLVLAYGVKQCEHLAYQPLLEHLKKNYAEKFSYIPCVTQEQPAKGYAGRVTQALRDGELEKFAGTKINAEDNHFMLCGNQLMIKDMFELLGERGLKKHLRRSPGQISSEKYH